MQDFRYKAFVSYSWSDAAWGKWLLHAIETYRTPKAMIGKAGANGPVPERLHPLFKDREEEAAGASIGAAVEAALATSEFLIVICSPRSAKSQWVNREIAWFKTHRDPNKILALIVDGEPGGGELECFPKALTHQVLPDLTVSDIPVDAPLAADARISGDGRRKARLKLAAAMLGVGLGELVNRDEARRTLRTRIVVGTSLALATVMSGMAWYAVQARNEAEHQRAESDGLVEFMLTDLRDRLEPVGRLDALDVVGQRALRYYAGQKASRLDADALGRRARALHLVGEVRDLRGDSETALKAFDQAAKTTGELLARDPDNPQRIFDHAQSVYWVGYIAYQRGDIKAAEAQFREYKRLADQLMEIDPKKPEWQMEVAYSESNLGTLYIEQGRYEEAERAFAGALTVVEALARTKPNDLAIQTELAGKISWLASAREKLGRHQNALELLAREQTIYERILQRDPGNTDAMRSLVNAIAATARSQLALGDSKGTLEQYAKALALNQKLLTIEPGNSLWKEFDVRVRYYYADALILAGQPARAVPLLEVASRELEELVRSDPKNQEWNVTLRSLVELAQGNLSVASNRGFEAAQLFDRITRRIPGHFSGLDATERNSVRLRAGLQTGNLLTKIGRWNEARKVWASVADNPSHGEDTLDKSVRYAALLRLGRIEEARKIDAQLWALGYRHPFYMRERVAKR